VEKVIYIDAKGRLQVGRPDQSDVPEDALCVFTMSYNEDDGARIQIEDHEGVFSGVDFGSDEE
jgi:hypothetical protein